MLPCNITLYCTSLHIFYVVLPCAYSCLFYFVLDDACTVIKGLKYSLQVRTMQVWTMMQLRSLSHWANLRSFVLNRSGNVFNAPRLCRYSSNSCDRETPKVSLPVFLTGVTFAALAYYYNKTRQKNKQKQHGSYNKLHDRNFTHSGTFVKHDKFWLPEDIFKDRNLTSNIKDFRVEDDDCLVVSFPKSGLCTAES